MAPAGRKLFQDKTLARHIMHAAEVTVSTKIRWKGKANLVTILSSYRHVAGLPYLVVTHKKMDQLLKWLQGQ
eukprot:765299-Hanusia_phi.AAC.1